MSKRLLLTMQLRAICLMRYMSIVRIASYDVCCAVNCDDLTRLSEFVDIVRGVLGVFGAEIISPTVVGFCLCIRFKC